MKTRLSFNGAAMLGLALGLAVLVVACSLATGCASDAQTRTGTKYNGYDAGTGISSQNVQTNSPLPGPRYYQSTSDPYHQN